MDTVLDHGPSYADQNPYGIGMTDSMAGIDFERMRAERLRRTQSALRNRGVAAAIFLRLEHLRYALAVRGHNFTTGLSYALVFAEHPPILYETGTMVRHQQRYCPWLGTDNVRTAFCWLDGICGPDAAREQADKFAEGIARALEEKGLRGEPVGIDGLDELGRSALRKRGIELVDVNAAMMEVRRRKTPDEVACVETAIAIANAGYRTMLDFKPGMRERDGGAAIYDALVRAGAEAVAGGLRSKFNTFDVYHESNTDRIVDPGDLVTVNLCSTKYAGYKVCIYRSFIVGRKPNAKERAWYERVHERVYGVIEAIRPGGTTADAAKALVPARTWGYDDEEAVAVAEVGHGIGLTYEEPCISRSWSFAHPQTFEPGMVIAVECREGEWGYGGVRLEEMVLVTETGNRILTTWPSDEIVPVATIG